MTRPTAPGDSVTMKPASIAPSFRSRPVWHGGDGSPRLSRPRQVLARDRSLGHCVRHTADERRAAFRGTASLRAPGRSRCLPTLNRYALRKVSESALSWIRSGRAIDQRRALSSRACGPAYARTNSSCAQLRSLFVREKELAVVATRASFRRFPSSHRADAYRVKLIVTVTRTGTGTPFRRVGVYSHCRTASSAA